ncbi:transcription initiation factor TFIID subunit 3-like [Haliotis rufescens]|uniref:transcription initiation factor TFIID subunit 3-like n=1 Tax=Haliotis rufescens TaxID=6454 RepID=UPI00201EE367|nr:transcription initiation factor TFIID subunit 3-like [Haliotis rufescens]
MNELRIQGLLHERYKTHFLGLLHKILRPAPGTPCSYPNKLASRPVKSEMRQPLKEKLQNAINRALLPDNDLGALIVGGRRRNRKKKPKPKNNVKNKKNAKKTEGKNKRLGLLSTREDSGHESEPLIEDEAEDWKENQDWEQEADDRENSDPNKMPFNFLKKSKKDKKDKKDKKKDSDAAVDDAKPEDQQPIVDAPDADQTTPPPKVFKEGTTLATMASSVPKKPEPVKDQVKDEEYPDGGFVPSNHVAAAPSNDPKTSQPAAQEKENPEKPADTDETELKKLEIKDAPVKSENSPLINKNGDVKESKLQDSQPGMLCCTIL